MSSVQKFTSSPKEEITERRFDIESTIEKMKGKTATCKDLTSLVIDLMKLVHEQGLRIANLEKINSDKDKKIRELEEEGANNDLSNRINRPSFNYLVTQMRSEIKERESIEDNIIISGIKLKGVSEEEIEKNDIKQVDTILSVLNLSRDKVETQSRIKAKNATKTNLILIKFKDRLHGQSALKEATKLRGRKEFDGIYLNKDKTKNERVVERDSRQDRNKRNALLGDKNGEGKSIGTYQGKKFYWGIRYGELKRIFV